MKGQKTWEKIMIKTLFAIAILSGSMSVFADDIDHYNDSTTNSVDHYNDTTATYPTPAQTPTSDQYQDTSSSTMSSTTTEPTSTQYSDESTSSMSATGTQNTQNTQDTSGSQYNSINNSNTNTSAGAMNTSGDNTVTGTMGSGESLSDKYQKLHVGLLTGLDAAEGNQNGTSTELGVDIGYQPSSVWGVGVEGSTSKLDTPDEDTRRTMVLGKATARFGGDIPFVKDVYVGGAAGPVFARSKVRLGVGPLAGFDIPLTARSHDFLSLGLNAKYILTNDTPDSLISAIALKYWF
jgi:hypothetical protein